MNKKYKVIKDNFLWDIWTIIEYHPTVFINAKYICDHHYSPINKTYRNYLECINSEIVE